MDSYTAGRLAWALADFTKVLGMVAANQTAQWAGNNPPKYGEKDFADLASNIETYGHDIIRNGQ